MSDLARAFLERWVVENVSSVPPQLQQAEVERLVAACLSDAYEQGFTEEVFTVRGWLALAAPAATPKPIVQKMSDLWVAAADSEPGRKMMESFGLTEKPLNHEEVMKDYEVLKATVIPRIVALGITPE